MAILPKKPEFLKQAGAVAALSTICTALFTFLINFQQQSRSDFAFVTKELKEQILILREENEKLRHEVSHLQNQIAALSSMQYESPLPTWRKSIDGKMLQLNKAYEQTFLVPNGKDRFDYIGKTDKEFWGDELGNPIIAQSYRKADINVMNTRTTIRTEQFANLDGVRVKLIVYKYPVWSSGPEWNGRKIIGVGGIAVVVR